MFRFWCPLWQTLPSTGRFQLVFSTSTHWPVWGTCQSFTWAHSVQSSALCRCISCPCYFRQPVFRSSCKHEECYYTPASSSWILMKSKRLPKSSALTLHRTQTWWKSRELLWIQNWRASSQLCLDYLAKLTCKARTILRTMLVTLWSGCLHQKLLGRL